MYRISLHSHITPPPQKKLSKEFLELLLQKPPTLVLGITNSNNNNHYKNFLKSLNNLKFQISSPYKDHFFSITKNNKTIYFVKTDEIATDKGHILVIGFKGKIHHRRIKETLKEAHRQNCIIIANHPLHEFAIPHFIIKDVLGAKRKISMNKKILTKYKKQFDALELNSYFPEDWKDIKAFARKNKLPIVSDSDAHFTNEIFTSYYQTKNLDFSSPNKFKRSLKKAIHKQVKLHAKAFGLEAEYKHGFQILWHRIKNIFN